jgi:hypothetical protein
MESLGVMVSVGIGQFQSMDGDELHHFAGTGKM